MGYFISAELSDESREAVKTKISEIEALLPFLKAIATSDKKYRRRMGQKSVEYVNLGLRGAKNFGKYIPQSFNMEEYTKDVNLVSQLWELRVPIASLLESIDDTIFAASSDSMYATDTVYSYLKTAAKNDASAKSHVDEMKKRYERKSSSSKAKPTNEEQPTTTE